MVNKKQPPLTLQQQAERDCAAAVKSNPADAVIHSLLDQQFKSNFQEEKDHE